MKKLQEQSQINKLEEFNKNILNQQNRQSERLISKKFKNDRALSVTFGAKINKLTKLQNNYN